MSDSRNPFYTEDKNPFSGGGGGSRNPFETGQDRQASNFNSYNPGGYGYDAGRPTMQQQLQASQDRQLETQKRALQSMYSSERMGVDTAQELVRQGEVLNRTEEKLDHIEAVQKESQRHINSLGSMFGGVKNWFRGDSAKKRGSQTGQQYEPAGASLDKAMAVSSTAEARRVASQEPAYGFGAPATGATGYQQQQQQQHPQSAYDRAFSDNLGEMEQGMGRLKQLAMGLGSEIDRQNGQLERMSVKTDRTNAKMDEQNAQMNRILYGSKAPPPAKK